MKKREVKVVFSNRWLYTLILIGVALITGVGIYALSPGVAPNPGHAITEIAPPSGCTTGQYLSWAGAAWACTDASFNNIPGDLTVGGNVKVSGSDTSQLCIGDKCINSFTSQAVYQDASGYLKLGTSCSGYYNCNGACTLTASDPSCSGSRTVNQGSSTCRAGQNNYNGHYWSVTCSYPDGTSNSYSCTTSDNGYNGGTCFGSTPSGSECPACPSKNMGSCTTSCNAVGFLISN